jgi:hypothetical protein
MTLRLNGTSSGFTEIDAPAAAGSNKITLPTSNGSAEQFLKNSGTAGELEFSSMVETSTGVGIGTTSPSHKCQITGTLAVDSYNDTTKTITLRPGYEANANGGMGLVAKDHSGAAADGLGVYGTDGVSLHTANAGTFYERMRIDSSGAIKLGNSSSTTNSIINQNAGAKMNLSAGGTGTAQIDLYGQTHSSSPKEIRMSTNGAERFKMNSSGHSQFRAASYVVEARSIAASSSSNTFYSGAHSSTGFGLGTITYEVYTNGNVKNSNNSYGSLSDQRLKENIVDATSQWDDIKSLQIRKFNFREATGYDTHTQLGLVAQEVETVCPGLVQTTPVREDATPVLDAEGNALETIKTVSTSVLYMKAVKALQEAQTRIETLETQNTAQQTQIDDLLARVTALEAA